MPAPDRSSKGTWYAALGILIVLVLAAAGYIWFSYAAQRGQVGAYDQFKESVQEAWNGNYRDASARLATLPQTPGTRTFANALILVQATSTSDYMRLGQDLNAQFAAATDPLEKALIVDSMSDAAFAAYDEGVFSEVFSHEPFKSLRVTGDDVTSMIHLADYSLSLQPTSRAYESKARAEAIHATHFARIDPAQSKQLIQSSLSDIQKSNAQMDADASLLHSSALWIAVPAWHDYWTGYTYSIIASMDSSYTAQAAAAYKAAAQYYDATVDAQGNPYQILEAPTIAADLAYARLLSGEKASQSDIQSAISHFLKIADMHHSDADHSISYLARAKGAAMPQHGAYVALAGLSPDFKQYLISLGWKETDFK